MKEKEFSSSELASPHKPSPKEPSPEKAPATEASPEDSSSQSLTEEPAAKRPAVATAEDKQQKEEVEKVKEEETKEKMEVDDESALFKSPTEEVAFLLKSKAACRQHSFLLSLPVASAFLFRCEDGAPCRTSWPRPWLDPASKASRDFAIEFLFEYTVSLNAFNVYAASIQVRWWRMRRR